MIGETRPTQVAEVARQPHKMTPPTMRVPNAKENLHNLLRDCLMAEPRWLDGYDKVAEWMANGKHKGLLLIGNVGTGKTLIATKLIPYLVEKCSELPLVMDVYKARDLNNPSNFDNIIRSRFKAIDDIGTETPSNDYGIQRWTFCDVVDEVERRGQFLVLTTNLTAAAIKKRYGERTFDRLRSICKVIALKGESQRGLDKQNITK